ncbi:MAG: Fic family protein [Patulibacter sp.]
MPVAAATLIGRIDQRRGREELHQVQAPQLLQRLAVSARVQSITASNAIENVIVSSDRALALIQAPERTAYADRTEQEFAGYRDASDYVTGKTPEPLSLPLLLHLHRLLLRHTGDPLAGRLKQSDNFIGVRRADGSAERIFTPVAAGEQTAWHLEELVARYESAVAAAQTPPLVLVCLLTLDLLAIHPFQDGNGRVARLVTTCELLRHGYGVARYASLEQRIFESKNTYYAQLRASQRAWHNGLHDPWPWTTYLLRAIDDAYTEFEARVVDGRALTGSKLQQAKTYVLTQAGDEFQFSDLTLALPDISPATLRKALAELAAAGQVQAGRGRSARWRRCSASSPYW